MTFDSDPVLNQGDFMECYVVAVRRKDHDEMPTMWKALGDNRIGSPWISYLYHDIESARIRCAKANAHFTGISPYGVFLVLAKIVSEVQ